MGVTLRTGPWPGARVTTDPFDDSEDTLVDAGNVYNPDPEHQAGTYARPGWALANGGDPLVTSSTPFRGQGGWYFTDLSNTTTNFCAVAGHLFIVDATGNATDVTPVDVTIDPGVTTRVYGTGFGNQLVVTDGVNAPWIASDLTSVPITGTYIDYDGMGTSWSAFGPGKVSGGAMWWIVEQTNGVSARTDFMWSTPGDATTGYQQPNYDFRWTIEQTSTLPLYAMAPREDRLVYFRQNSIGSISGAVGPGLAANATHDAIAQNLGTISPQTLVQFGETTFFTDATSRPYRLVAGSNPEPIWKQMRSIVDASSVGYPAVNRIVSTAAFEAFLNLYICGLYSPIPSQDAPVTEAEAFDMNTGRYFSRWTIKGATGDGVQMDALFNWLDSNGRPTLVALGSLDAPSDGQVAASGYLWTLNSLIATGDTLTTEDTPGVMIGDESTPIRLLTTEGNEGNWMDNGEVPNIYIVTDRQGYSADQILTVDRVTALVAPTIPVQVSAQTAQVAMTLEGTPTPNATQDGIARVVVGFDGIVGRGVEVKVQPTTADSQWFIEQVVVNGSTSTALPDDS